MLEPEHAAQQSEAGPSRPTNRPTKQVVPTSDEEDIFFVSQSSDKYGSSLDSVKPIQRRRRDVSEDDEEDDEEAVLPIRHSAAHRRQSPTRHSPAVESSSPTAQSVELAPDAPQETRSIDGDTAATVTVYDTIMEDHTPATTMHTTLPPTTLPSPAPAPVLSPLKPPDVPRTASTVQTASSTDSISNLPSARFDEVSIRPDPVLDEQAMSMEVDGDVTIGREYEVQPSSQQSDVTLPFVENSLASPQPSPPSSPAVLLHDSSLIGDNLRQSEEQPAISHEEQEVLQPSPPIDTGRPHDLTQENKSMEPATDAADGGRHPDLVLSLSSTPPLSPLRIPKRGAAPPRLPDLLQHIPQAEPVQSSRDAVPDDEQLAKAAAAQPPTPPRRQLRTRNAAQLNPYTLEAARYQRALLRNDWQDAVVSQREWHRQERKRLAEEAARAQRDNTGAQGSEESQSQWLVPSSGPSSQADHEDLSAPSSPAAATMPEVFVEIPLLGETDSVRRHAGAARPASTSPTPSQSGRLPDLAEMLASRNASTNRHRDRPGPSRPATYKGPRTTAQVDANGQTAPPQASEDSQVHEDDSVPLPILTRRRPPPRALSPSESAATPTSDRQTPALGDAFIVDSSEDERPAPAAPITKAKRRSRWSGDGSSSDSTDYERRFRQLKKMMPAGMARKHIRDLRAMRHGKSYHSDGHLSSSSSDAAARNRTEQRTTARPRSPSVNADGSSDDEELRPGQTRKRLRRHDSLNGNNALLLDPDSDSSSSSGTSLSSEASVSFACANLMNSNTDADRHKEVEDIDERPAQWWSVHRLDSEVPYRERDAIDRMLSRTEGRKTSSHAGVRRAKGTPYHRQARLDGFVSAHRQKERATHSTRSHLQEIDQNQRRQARFTKEMLDKDGQPRVSSRKKKRRKLDPRVGRTTTAGGRGASGPLLNPPVVRPRVRPRLDLEQHELLFTANPAPRRYAETGANIYDAPGDDALSDDDGQWQILSRVVRDSTPVNVLDSRLAAPRVRAGIAAQPGPSLFMAKDAAPSPARDVRESPSASVSSAGLARLHAVNGHSPGTPTRAHADAFPPKGPLRTIPGPLPTLHPGPATASTGSDAWDDFEGISLDFGIAPFAEAISLKVGDSSLLARLPDLMALPDQLLRQEHVPRAWTGPVLRLEETVLDIDMDHDELAAKLPFYMDSLRLTISRALGGSSDHSSVDGGRRARNLIADTNAFLGCWLVRQAQGAGDGLSDAASIFRSYRTILERIEQLQASVLSLSESAPASKTSREDRKSLCLQLAWMRFELCWRAMAICDADANYALEPEAPTVESLLTYSRTLMSLLLHHGLHRCVRNVRKAATAGYTADASTEAAMDDEEEEAAHVFVDEATAMWLSVIHLLDSFEKSREVMDGRLFWTQFETAFQRWDDSMPKRAPLLRSESLWYCLFALELLSQISPVAQTQASPLLRECWPLVTRALSLIHFRSGESKELANGWHMLAKRDAYVRLVLQRCCLLTSEWQWTMEGAEVTLARLFDIFNSHKLADLPTEKQHDFPAFLRDFDVDKLSTADVAEGEATRDPGFHLFIRLLGRTGQELRASAADAKEGDRRISRLFSRMTPVRVMPFTRTDVPTSSQRSVLFNHYNVIMLFLYLVPASSPQRLRQIQSFLPAFKDADFVSQVTCIRAMMYVATIFRHHCLDLSPVTRWFGETITVLRREYEELDSTTKQYERRQMQESLQARGGQSAARPDALRMAAIFENAPARQAALRRKEELARLLVVALRSIQHIIRHGDLDGGRARPEGSDQRLLHYSLLSPAWTQQMLEAQMSLEPRIGQEVLRCIQTFLLARIKILQPAQSTTTPANGTGISNQGTASAVHANQPQPPGNEESQDSFADLFEADDDFDFEDPLLARLLDEGDTSTEGDVRNPDRQREASKALALAAAANERTKWNREFADLVKSSISPSLFQLLSNIYHPDRRVEAAATGSVVMSLGVTERLDEIPVDGHADRSNAAATSRTKMNRLLKAAEARQFLELVVDCWAGCAQVLVTNGLREWSSYLGFGNESWKRIDDPIGRRDVGLRFLQNVLSLDPTAVQKREYEVEFLAVWIQTAVARVLSVQDVYTKSLIEAAMGSKNQSTLMYALATQWRAVIVDAQSSPSMAADDVGDTNRTSSLDLDAFTTHRLALLNATYTTLAASLSTNATTMGTAYSILSALLSSLRAYVEDTPVASSKGPSLDYLRFCRTTLSDVESKLGSASVMISLKGEFSAAVQLVTARLAVVERGLKGVDQERPL